MQDKELPVSSPESSRISHVKVRQATQRVVCGAMGLRRKLTPSDSTPRMYARQRNASRPRHVQVQDVARACCSTLKACRRCTRASTHKRNGHCGSDASAIQASLVITNCLFLFQAPNCEGSLPSTGARDPGAPRTLATAPSGRHESARQLEHPG